MRAIDLHSRRLRDAYGLTAPQLATLAEAERLGSSNVGALARALHLSQPTVSDILDRLERRGLLRRQRSLQDRRSVVILVTEEGRAMLRRSPSLLQDTFRERLSRLADWERHWLLAALQRVAAMMDAEDLDAAPVLETGPLAEPPPAAGPGASSPGAEATMAPAPPSDARVSGRRDRGGRARAGGRGSGGSSPAGA